MKEDKCVNIGYPSFWKNASSKRKRIYLIILFFVAALIVTIAGALVPLSAQESKQLYDQVNQTTTLSPVPLAVSIFLHNFPICLGMFIPLVGAIFGLFVMLDTGIALGAELRVESSPNFQGQTVALTPSTAVLALTLIAVVFTLEYVSYSTGMSESIWLFRRITQHRLRHELKNTGILIGIVAVLLTVGAVVETLTIKAGY
jgi:hypothetical protein